MRVVANALIMSCFCCPAEPMSGTGMGITVEEEDAATGMLSGTWPLMSAGALVLPITFTLLENLTHHS